jgi:hypothetical protein
LTVYGTVLDKLVPDGWLIIVEGYAEEGNDVIE